MNQNQHESLDASLDAILEYTAKLETAAKEGAAAFVELKARVGATLKSMEATIDALRAAAPDPPDPGGDPPKEEPPTEVDVPTTPAVPADPARTIEPQAPLEIVREHKLTPDMEPRAIAAAVSHSAPGTRFLVYGDIGELQLGGANNVLSAAAWGSQPVTDIEFVGATEDAVIGGLTLRNDNGGFERVDFRNLGFRPQMDGAFAPVRSWQHQEHPNSIVTFDGVHLFAPDDYHGFDGHGMKWGWHLQMLGYVILRSRCAAAREHSGYDLQCNGYWIDDLYNETRLLPNIDGDLVRVGNGRTMWQWQERRTTGPPAAGGGVARNMLADRCGHEGLLGASRKAQGGSCFTIGGRSRGKNLWQNLTALAPLAGGVAVWAEANKDGLKGYDDPATLELTIQGYRQKGYGGRTPMLLSSIGRLTMSDLEIPGGADGVVLNHQKGVKPIAEVEWDVDATRDSSGA